MTPKITSRIKAKDIEIDTCFSREAFIHLTKYMMAVKDFTDHIGSNLGEDTNDFVNETLFPWLIKTMQTIESGEE